MLFDSALCLPINVFHLKFGVIKYFVIHNFNLLFAFDSDKALDMAIVRTAAVVSALLVSFIAFFYQPVALRLKVLGVTRPLEKIVNIHGQDFRLIPDTLYCEDLHYHQSSNLLFGTAEEKPESRWKWFPPFVESTAIPSSAFPWFQIATARNLPLTYLRASIAKLDESYALDRGTIIVVDPEVYRHQHLLQSNVNLYTFGPPDE